MVFLLSGIVSSPDWQDDEQKRFYHPTHGDILGLYRG
jgi:hypothetical protein